MSDAMPSIVLSEPDASRLERLADLPESRRLPAMVQLREELARARVMPAAELPSDVVTMNSSLDCVDEGTGTTRTLTLVYPGEANIAQGRVSVLSPVGMALLGLRVGQTIDWPVPAGKFVRLTVTALRAAEPLQ